MASPGANPVKPSVALARAEQGFEPVALQQPATESTAAAVAHAVSAGVKEDAASLTLEIQPIDHLAAEEAPPIAISAPPVYEGPVYEPATHDRSSEIFEAIDSGDAGALATLLEEGVPAGVVDDNGNTPLHKAAEGETECAKVLVSKLDAASGVFEARNVEGETCLMVAIKYEDATLCSTFAAAGALCTQEVIDKARTGEVPEVISAVTGEEVAARAVVDRGDDAQRRVSVSGGNVEEFTKTYNNEQGVEVARRISVKGGQAEKDANNAVTEAVAEGFVEPPA